MWGCGNLKGYVVRFGLILVMGLGVVSSINHVLTECVGVDMKKAGMIFRDVLRELGLSCKDHYESGLVQMLG